MKNNLCRGKEVVVISGTEKGKRGKILNVMRSKNRVIVEGVNFCKKHVKKSQESPNGAIVEKEAALHISNVMILERYEKKQERKKITSSATKNTGEGKQSEKLEENKI